MTGGMAALATGLVAGASGAETDMNDIPFSATTPVSVGRVGLRSRDAAGLAAYYEAVLGLRPLRRTGNLIALGTGERELIEIEQSEGLQPDDPRHAGLFHTAFLLPTRAELARWTRHAIDRRIPVDGASDHLVSEAIYLTDPEGNGIEIYADRPRETWTFDAGSVRMATDPLDFDDLMKEIGDGDAWRGAPDGTVVGHVHLRVGDAAEAEAWWQAEMAMETMAHYGDQAVFMASGGYHHHIGANTWQSRRAGRRDQQRTGLAFVELRSTAATGESEAVDPWGTAIRSVPA